MNNHSVLCSALYESVLGDQNPQGGVLRAVEEVLEKGWLEMYVCVYEYPYEHIYTHVYITHMNARVYECVYIYMRAVEEVLEKEWLEAQPGRARAWRGKSRQTNFMYARIF